MATSAGDRIPAGGVHRVAAQILADALRRAAPSREDALLLLVVGQTRADALPLGVRHRADALHLGARHRGDALLLGVRRHAVHHRIDEDVTTLVIGIAAE